MCVGLTACTQGSGRSSVSCPKDPVLAQSLRDLATFTDWLARFNVRGYIGEVGWPGTSDPAQWNRVGDAWYTAADRAGLWVTAWAAGEQWPPSYPLAIFRGGATHDTLQVTGPQAAVVAAHPSSTRYLRGVDVADGAFGAESPSYSNTNVGRYGADYRYDSAASFRYLALHGVRLVRLAFTWERVQPRLRAPLDRVEVERLRRAVLAAHAAGLSIVLDLHNFGYYRSGDAGAVRALRLGDPELPTSDLADVWARLSTKFNGLPGVVGYDLMNEPHDLPAGGAAGGELMWQRASQQAVSALRARHDDTLVLVEGYAFAGTGRWSSLQPRPWIHDPAHQVRYEAHQYFDHDGSGLYTRPYAAERRSAAQALSPGCAG